MHCVNCFESLSDSSESFGHCRCRNNHYQCFNCDHEKQGYCASCDAVTMIELPKDRKKDEDSLIDLSESISIKSFDDLELSKSTTTTKYDLNLLFSSDLSDTDLDKTLMPDNEFGFEVTLDGMFRPKSPLISPNLTEEDGSLSSLENFNVLSGDKDIPMEFITTNSVSATSSTQSFASKASTKSTASYLDSPPSLNMLSSTESEQTLTKKTNAHIKHLNSLRGCISKFSLKCKLSTESRALSSKSSSVASPSRVSLQKCRLLPTENETDEEETTCFSIDKPLQKILEGFHQSESKPNWSKMDSRMPDLVAMMRKSPCSAEEMPWLWLSLLSKTLKRDSENPGDEGKA